MSTSDRLAELRRQRALMQAHLAWLDGEIQSAEKGLAAPTSVGPASAAGAAGAASAPLPTDLKATPTPAVRPGAALTKPADDTVGAPTDTDSILEQYRTQPRDLQRDVRTGCLLYFAAALLILGGIVTILYFALRRT